MLGGVLMGVVHVKRPGATIGGLVAANTRANIRANPVMVVPGCICSQTGEGNVVFGELLDRVAKGPRRHK